MNEWIKRFSEFRKRNNDLLQILSNVVIIGFFSIAENWLLFYLGSWTLSIIFGCLKIMMWCVLAINIYTIVKKKDKKDDKPVTHNDMQMQAVLYKQMKKMEADIPEGISNNTTQAFIEWEERLNQKMEEVKITQLRSIKAVLDKQEELAKLVQQLEAGQADVPDMESFESNVSDDV